MSAWNIVGPSRIDVDLRVPGDKSITHRAVLFAHIAGKTVRIEGPLDAQDTRRTLAAVMALGSSVEETRDAWTIGPGGAAELDCEIDCGNSGTTMRLLAGVLSPWPGRYRLRGDRSLESRPMGRIVEPLRTMGARIDGREDGRFAPLEIEGGVLRNGMQFDLPIASAQVKSAILLAALRAGVSVSVTEPGPSRDHTERMMAAWGCGLRRADGLIRLDSAGGDLAVPSVISVPGDLSSAAFWMVGAAVTGGTATIRGVGLNPTRTGVIDAMRSAGVAIVVENETSMGGEPVGDLRVDVDAGTLRPFEIRGTAMVRCIDEIPILAVLASRAPGTSRFADAQELRVKESDRIRTTVQALQAFGVPVDETPDGFVVHGGGDLQPASVDAAGDHRIAMASAILAHCAPGPSRVEGAAAAQVSYPGFEDHLDSLVPAGSHP